MIAPQIIEAAREADIVAVITSRGVELSKKGGEYSALCPFHSEKSSSFTVSPSKGFYHCFGCGAHGDAIDFLMKHVDLDFQEAVQQLTGGEGKASSTAKKSDAAKPAPTDEWVAITPVPADAPKPPVLAWVRCSDGTWREVPANNMWAYRDANGALLGYIQRFDIPAHEDKPAGKEIRPLTYCRNNVTGELAWRRRHFPQPRPLFGLDKLAQHPKASVVVVEGEKAAVAAQEAFIAAGATMDKLIVVSWPGGANGVRNVDWSPLHGRKIGLWPDADQKRYKAPHPGARALMPFVEQPGTAAMLDVHESIKDHCSAVKFFLPRAAGIPDGWDLADEPPENFDPKVHVKTHAMKAADVRTRFSHVPSFKPGEGVLPVWLVPPTSEEDIERAAFAADLCALQCVGVAQTLDPRGVVMQHYSDVAGLRAALDEVKRFMPNARVHAIIPETLWKEADGLQGCTKQLLPSGASWVDDLLVAVADETRLRELKSIHTADVDAKADLNPGARQMAEQALERAVAAQEVQAGALEQPQSVMPTRDEERRRQQQEENRRLQEVDTGAMIPSDLSVEAMIERCVWVADGRHVAYVTDDRSMFLKFDDFRALTVSSKTEIEVQQREKLVSKWYPNANLWQSDMRRVDAMTATFHPGSPIITANPNGLRAVNTWRPIKRWPATADITPFLEQVEYLFPDPTERNAFLDWLAHIEQKPGELPHYGWLHIAENTGTGRNWMASVLARVFRGYVAPNVDLPGLLDSPYNGELGGRVLAIIDEVQEGASEGNYRHAERLKSMVNAEMRTVNNKYGMKYIEFNTLRWLVFSNHKNALPLNDEDRRFRVVMHKAPPRSPEMYERLYALLQDVEFVNGVGVYLRERDISRFKPGERPPLNADKRAAIAASKPMSTQAAEEIVACWPADVITYKHAIELLTGDPEKKDFPAGMRRAMEEAGAVTWGQGDVKRIKMNGAPHRVWVLRKRDKWMAESTDAIRREIGRANVNDQIRPAAAVLADAVEMVANLHEPPI